MELKFIILLLHHLLRSKVAKSKRFKRPNLSISCLKKVKSSKNEKKAKQCPIFFVKI